MTFDQLAHKLGKMLSDHAPVILTSVGAAGVLATAYLTMRASFQCEKIIRNAEDDEQEIFLRDKRTQFFMEQRLWTLFLPAATTGAISIAAIIGANRISDRRAAAVATAFAISERTFDVYREKMVERLGPKKEQAARDEIHQDAMNRDPVTTREVIITGNGNILCRDAYSGRYFESSIEEIKKAQNDLNYRVNAYGSASLGEFYDLLGLDRTSHCEDVGWNTDELLELEISPGLTPAQNPCISFSFRVKPLHDYYKGH